ncbi:unnamed protein product [Linum trigynum]|uniref:Pentatricopeptide repeat-containing protein n=1 Tax=Linum trigynum TaxID=586398 RepID=A0AAV2D824_9ROSI
MAAWSNVLRQVDLQSDPNRVISMFRAIQKVAYDSPVLDPYAYASLIKACNKLKYANGGKSVHGRAVKLGYDGSLSVRNSLIHLYAGSEILNYARVLFDGMPERNVVTVNGMLSGFLKNNRFVEGLRLFHEAFGEGLKPNHVTLVVLISGCVEAGRYRLGMLLHSFCCKSCLDSAVEVGNALLDFYAKFGFMNDAVRLFSNMLNKDLVSWNTMVAGYAKNGGNLGQAFSLFREMRNGYAGYDRVSLVNLALACANGRDLVRGKMVHGHVVVATGADTSLSLSVGTVFINMYSKCGFMEYARRIFRKLPDENVASWNSMIHGCVERGQNSEALALFDSMKSRRMVRADEVTMLGLISACRNSGQLSRGTEIHLYIDAIDHLGKSLVLQNALIDMYAKCGIMDRARLVFDKMPQKDVISWTTLIVGHAINGEGEEALLAFSHMRAEGINPNFVTFIGVLSACDHSGLVDVGMLEEAKRFMEKMSMEPNGVVWRMLVNACRVHGDSRLGLSSVDKLMEANKSSVMATEDRVLCANVFAETEKWNEVLHERTIIVSQKDPKVAGISSIWTQ